MPEVNKVRHVLTFTSEEFPDKSHEVYGVLGDKTVKMKISELAAAMKDAGYPHEVNADFRVTRAKTAAVVAPIQEPEPTAAEDTAESRHTRRAAA